MKHRTPSEILEELVKLTSAYPIEATAEDKEEMRILEEQKVRSARDAKLSAEVRARTKREKESLEQARGRSGRSGCIIYMGLRSFWDA